MLAVPLSEAAVAPLIAEVADVSVAVVNTPEATVVAGPEAAIARVEAALAARGVSGQRVATSHAFHSAMMAPIVDAFAARVATIPRATPSGRWISNVTGTWVTPAQAVDPAYWAQHLRQPVRFAEGVATLLGEDDVQILEVGPGRTLGGFLRRHPAAAGRTARATIGAAAETGSDLDRLLLAVGRLWTDGVEIDWQAYWSGQRRRRVPLPTYPFERQRYWSDPLGEAVQQQGGRPLLQGLAAPPPSAAATNLDDVGQWFSVPIWRQSPSLARPRGASNGWLVIRNDDGFGRHMENALTSRGEAVVTVDRAAMFTERNDHAFALRFDEPADYAALFERLRARGRMPDRIICSAPARSRRSAADETLDRDAFFVPLALVQALAADPSPARIAIITANAYEAIGGDGVLPEGALAGGVARVARREVPHVMARVVDLPLVDAPSTSWPALARFVLDEFDIEDAVPVVAYRNGRRWVQEFEPVALEAPAPDRAPLAQGGAYLITGGLGGLGLTIAAALAKPGARLALVGRTGLPQRDDWPSYLERAAADDRRARQIRAVQALEAAGAKVMAFAADVADRVSMGMAVSAARAAFGHFDAVFHAAGVAGGGLIALKTKEAAAAVLAPKVRGTRALLTALEGDFPDIVVLFSSIAAVTGDIGQVDYAAANACLDAVAQSAAARGRRIVSIGWDAWQSVGMAVETEVSGSLRRQRADAVSRGITPDRGVDALQRVLSHPFAQVVVSPSGLASRMAEAAAAAGLVAATTASATARHPRPDLGHAVRGGALEGRGRTGRRLGGSARRRRHRRRRQLLRARRRLAARDAAHRAPARRLRPRVLAARGDGARDRRGAGGDARRRAVRRRPPGGAPGRARRAVRRGGRSPPARAPRRPRGLMSDRTDPLARLSPAKRALFELMARQGAAASGIPRRAVATPAPLSFAQERLWFLNRLDPDSAAYTVAHAVSYDGPLDAAIVERALALLTARHETLRTTFEEIDGRPVQCIAPAGGVSLERIDLSPLGEARARQELPAVAREAFARPFSLEDGPLFRTTLVTLAPGRHALLFAMHHIVSDAGALERLVREFAICVPRARARRAARAARAADPVRRLRRVAARVVHGAGARRAGRLLDEAARGAAAERAADRRAASAGADLPRPRAPVRAAARSRRGPPSARAAARRDALHDAPRRLRGLPAPLYAAGRHRRRLAGGQPRARRNRARGRAVRQHDRAAHRLRRPSDRRDARSHGRATSCSTRTRTRTCRSSSSSSCCSRRGTSAATRSSRSSSSTAATRATSTCCRAARSISRRPPRNSISRSPSMKRATSSGACSSTTPISSARRRPRAWPRT